MKAEDHAEYVVNQENVRTHWDRCWTVHLDCARTVITLLEHKIAEVRGHHQELLIDGRDDEH